MVQECDGRITRGDVVEKSDEKKVETKEKENGCGAMKNLKKGKRGFALLVAVCVGWTAGCFSASTSIASEKAYAETAQMSDGTLIYEQYDTLSVLMVTGTVGECIGELVIPDVYSGMSVVEIADGAFSEQTGMTRVNMPETIQKIGANAFKGCVSLEQIEIEGIVKSVGAGAFEQTAWMEAHKADELVILDDTVLVSVSDSVEELYVPETVRVIADEACKENKDLKTAVMTSSTGYIGNKSFYGCTSLTDAILPNGVKNIGDYAFTDSMIRRAVIPATVLSVGKGAFQGCTELEQITLWDGIVRIGSSAFSSCTSLKQAAIPDSVTELGSSAFKKCSSLQTVSLGIHITSIADYTFQGCTSLSSVTMGSKVTRIGTFAFNKCTALQSITLPEGLVKIGSDAFQSCMSLRDVNIPESVLDVGVRAFFDTAFYDELYEARGDSSFVIYNGTILLGYYGEDEYIEIPEGVKVIGGGAFASNETIKNVILSDSTLSLSSYAFENLWKAESITGLEQLQYAGEYAFAECLSLTQLDLPGSIGIISEGMAIGCENLAEVNISEGIKGIESDAFIFSGVTLFNIPKSVEYIEIGAFAECDNLEKIIINNKECELHEEFVSAGTLICGYEDSTAYEYTLIYGHPFEVLDKADFPATSTCTQTTTTTTASEQFGIEDDQCILELGTVKISEDELRNCGYTVEIPVSIKNTGGWKSMGYGISFDPSELAVKSAKLNSEIIDHIINNEGQFSHVPAINQNMGIMWHGIGVTGSELYCPDGIFAYITFQVDQAACSGDAYKITLLEENNGVKQLVYTVSGEKTCDLLDGYIIIEGKAAVTEPPVSSVVSSSTATTTTVTVIESTHTTTCTTVSESTSTTEASQTAPVQCGDIDGDGMIAISDASEILSMYAQYTAGMIMNEYMAMWIPAADTDRNNAIEINDAVLVLTYYAEVCAGITAESFENWRTAQ